MNATPQPLDSAYWLSRGLSANPTMREQILRLAADELSANGFEAFQVRRVCEPLFISRTLINHYFGSQNGLLAETTAAAYTNYVNHLTQMALKQDSPRAQLEAWMLAQLRWFHANRGIAVALYVPQPDFAQLLTEQHGENLRQAYRYQLAVIAHLIRGVQTDELLPIEFDVDNAPYDELERTPELLMRAISVGMHALGPAAWAAAKELPSHHNTESFLIDPSLHQHAKWISASIVANLPATERAVDAPAYLGSLEPTAITTEALAGREQLIEGAIAQLAISGPERFQSSALAEHLGVARTLINHHFGSQLNLIADAVVTEYCRYVEWLKTQAVAGSTPEQRLERWMLAQAEWTRTHPGLAIAIQLPHPKLAQAIADRMGTQMRRYFEYTMTVVGVLIRGVQRNEMVSLDFDVDTAPYVEFPDYLPEFMRTASVGLSSLGAALWAFTPGVSALPLDKDEFGFACVRQHAQWVIASLHE
ncbi:MAG: TetR/AcrR family transcriptional regulator [Microbacteriaceae bacterium]